MKQQLIFLQQQMADFEEKLSSLFETAKLSGPAYKKSVKLAEDWDRIIKHFNEIQSNVTPVEALEVIFPKKGFTPAVLKMWGFWKDYLAEQHQIFMKSRMEIMALKRLVELADGDSQLAIRIIEFSSGQGYRNLYLPTNTNPKNIAANDDQEDKY